MSVRDVIALPPIGMLAMVSIAAVCANLMHGIGGSMFQEMGVTESVHHGAAIAGKFALIYAFVHLYTTHKLYRVGNTRNGDGDLLTFLLAGAIGTFMLLISYALK